MRRLRDILLAAAIGAALTASGAAADDGSAETLSANAEVPTQPASETAAPAPEPAAPVSPGPSVERGDSLAPAAKQKPEAGSGVAAGKGTRPPKAGPTPSAEADAAGGAPAAPTPVFAVPSIPSSGCATYGVPPILIPIYQRAAAAYDLGPQGPAVLAGINEIETAFGTNLNVSSAGAVGWMQFLPSTWDMYGVDANGDGVADPYNPEDAIFSAAAYLSAAGMPDNTYDAIFAYNHADWYVADVLANAACYGGIGTAGSFSLRPRLEELECELPEAWREKVPENYLRAFEDAAARYDLGKSGVWALAAIARLESNFGEGMEAEELASSGPLGLDPAEWDSYAVDGNEDGRIVRANVADSAATMARLIWSRDDLRAGVFTHNQAAWYVQAVLSEAEALEGKCTATPVEWNLALPNAVIAPIDWENLTLSNELELSDLTSGAIDPRIVGLIGAISQDHEVTISALRSDHSKFTVEGNVSNHFFGRGVDIAAVDGVSCTDTAEDAPCAELARTLAYLPAPAHPTELIYCFDVDGPGPAFARSDHCDHVHAAYDQ